ncbi:hypothetical protein Acsp05_04110 [Actinokineospora sp. NBRC 105648]|nr:hypothetical protein Acsp05_04110 [Actinokineospora sp. NBRC 105648]
MRWSLVALGLVALLVLGWSGWSWLRDRMGERPGRAECAQGETNLKVAVTPSVEQPVREAANRWNTNRTVVAEHCVQVDVSSVESPAALAGLAGQWPTRELGDRPDAWLAESTLWTDRLSATDDALLASAPESIATSPVVLAAPEPAARLFGGPVGFRWGALPELTGDTTGWTRFGQPTWGRLTVAIPSPAASTASALAVQTALTGVAKQSPISQQSLARPPVAAALSALVAAQPADVPDSTRSALAKLGETADMITAPYSAVPALEVDLHRRNLAADGRPAARRPLFEVVAAGPGAVADFPYVTLGGGQADGARDAAADQFRRYLQEPAQQREFGRAGLRGTERAEKPPNSLGMTWGEIAPGFVPADRNTAQKIASTWDNAAEGGGIVTIMVDVSRTMGADGGDGRSRLDWVKAALDDYTDYTVSGSVGLWPFSHGLDKGKPYAVAVPTGPVANRRVQLHAAVAALKPAGATDFSESVAAGYRSAVQGYVPNRRNQLVVITDGGADGAMSLGQLKNSIRGLGDKAKPIRVDVIAIGRDANRADLRDLANSSGGTLAVLTDARGVVAALGQAVTAR